MRRTGVALIVLAVTAAIGVSSLPGNAVGEDERDKAAAEALEKAVARGKALFTGRELGPAEKSCSTCHADPEREKLHLASRVGDYPKWDRREKRVITLQTKLNQMIDRMLKGEKKELGCDDLVAIEAYLMSLVRNR